MKRKLTTVFRSMAGIREVFRREIIDPTSEGGASGFRMVPDGKEQYFYTTELDMTRLERLALRAAGNSSGKAIAGPIVVTVVTRRPL